MRNTLRHFLAALPTKLREQDKIKHMTWSFWLTLSTLLLLSAPMAFVAVFFLGLVKECWDHFYGSGFCMFDMTGNLIGSIAALILSSPFIFGIVC